MSFDFESIKNKANEAAQVAAKKTKQLASIAKANLGIYAAEDRIKKAQLELGKLYYRDYVVGEEMDAAEYLPWCEKISQEKATIEDLKNTISDLKSEEGEDFVILEDEPAPPSEEAE